MKKLFNNIQIINGGFNIKQWLIISLLLRLIVMPFTAHGDVFFIYKFPHIFSHGEWDTYGIAAEQHNIFYYPPFTLIFFAVVQFIFGFLFPGFEEFTHALRFLETKAIYKSEYLYLSLFLMKLPYLFFDCLIVLTCWKMLPNDKSKLIFTVFWAVNPLVIYSTFMFGQFDLIPAFFVVLACYFSLQRGREQYACLSIASGCIFKLFPIVFLPVVLLTSCRNVRDFIRLSLYGVVPVLLFYGVFYLISGEAVLKLLFETSFLAKFSFELKIFFLRFCQASAYFLVCLHILSSSREQLNYILLIQYFMVIYLAISWGLPSYSTHYFMWFIPFFILYIQQRPEWKKPFYLLLLTIFLAGLKSRPSCIGIFAPVNPEFFLSFPSLKDVTGFVFDLKTYDMTIDLLYKGISGLLLLTIIKNLYTPLNKPAVKSF